MNDAHNTLNTHTLTRINNTHSTTTASMQHTQRTQHAQYTHAHLPHLLSAVEQHRVEQQPVGQVLARLRGRRLGSAAGRERLRTQRVCE